MSIYQITSNAPLTGGAHGENTGYCAADVGDIPLGSGWRKGQFAYAVASGSGRFRLVSGDAVVLTPPGTTADSALAVGGAVTLECVADGVLSSTTPMVGASAVAYIAGTWAVGGLLTAVLPSSVATAGVQWQRWTNGVPADIAGATAMTYTPQAADVGAGITVSFRYTPISYSAGAGQPVVAGAPAPAPSPAPAPAPSPTNTLVLRDGTDLMLRDGTALTLR